MATSKTTGQSNGTGSDRNPVPIVGEASAKCYCPDCGSEIVVDTELEPGDEVECVNECEIVLAGVDPVVLELAGAGGYDDDDDDDDEEGDDEDDDEDDDDLDDDEYFDDDYENDDDEDED